MKGLNFIRVLLSSLTMNYAAVIDNGLMDDVLVNEYKANVDKLSSQPPLSDCEQVKQFQWLDFMLKQMTECAKDNLAAGNPQPVFKALLECVNLK